MTIICSYCGKRLGEKDGYGETHGVCDECYPDVLNGTWKKLEDDDGKL